MRAWGLVGVATLLGVAFVGVLRVPGLGETPTLLISNGGQLLAAVLAAAGCATAARRPTASADGPGAGSPPARRLGGRARRCGATTRWCWTGRVPFPSLADVGFLVFPVFAAVGLVTWLGSQSDELVARGRDLLDGLIIAGSLLVISWVTALGSVVAEGGDGWLPLTLSLAYPVGDLILATLVLLALSRGARSERSTPGGARPRPRRSRRSRTARTSTWSAWRSTPPPTRSAPAG